MSGRGAFRCPTKRPRPVRWRRTWMKLSWRSLKMCSAHQRRHTSIGRPNVRSVKKVFGTKMLTKLGNQRSLKRLPSKLQLVEDQAHFFATTNGAFEDASMPGAMDTASRSERSDRTRTERMLDVHLGLPPPRGARDHRAGSSCLGCTGQGHPENGPKHSNFLRTAYPYPLPKNGQGVLLCL